MKSVPISWSCIVELAMQLPGVEESLSYGQPSLKVKGKFFSRIRDEGNVLVVRTNIFGRNALIESDPARYFVTDHYRDHPYVLMDLRGAPAAEIRERLEEGWREVAPPTLLRKFDAGGD